MLWQWKKCADREMHKAENKIGLQEHTERAFYVTALEVK